MTIIITIYALNLPASIVKPTKGKEGAIQEYITYLTEAGDPKKTKRDNEFDIELQGMGTESSSLPTIAVQQHNLVIAEFGTDAWNNVTYTLEEIDPVDGILGYRIVSTGESISESEYSFLLHKYWEDIAEKEGVTYYDIFLADGEPVEKMEYKRVDIIAKYSDGIPVELTTISDAQTYRVNLSFNGKRVSDQKFEDFHFIIDDQNGNWTVFEGLTWAEPYPGLPEGD